MRGTGDSLDAALRVVAREVEEEDLDARLSWRSFAASELGENLPPVTVGRFEVLRRIGHGGFGRVYESWDPRLRRRVALKLHATAELSERARVRFLREAQTLARVSRPDIVEVFGFGTCDDGVYFAMALLEGSTLREWQSHPRPWRACVLVYVAIAEALAAVHGAGLVHRDVKPDNVIVGADGRVCLIDFGLAVADPTPLPTDRDRGTSRPSSTTTGGTVGYASPEQQVFGHADPRSDQFSLCVSLFEGLTGRWPLAPEQIVRMAYGEFGRPRLTGLPRSVARIIARGLQAEPSARWPDLATLAAALRRAASRRSSVRVWAPAAIVTALLPPVLLWGDRPCGAALLDDGMIATFEHRLLDDGVPEAAAAQTRDALAERRARIDTLRTDACDARDRDGAQADAVLACLRRADRAAVELTAADGVRLRGAARSAELLAALPDPQACVAAVDSGDDAAAQELLGAIDRVRVQLAVGAVLDANDGAAQAADAAAAIERPDLQLAARSLQARALDQLGRDVEAATILRAAVAQAQALDDDAAQADLWTRLARLESFDLDDAAAAEHALSQAEIAVRRLGDPPGPRIDLLLARASTREVAGDLDGLAAALDEAGALLEAHAADDDARVLQVMTRRANLAAVRGEWARADALYLDVRGRLLTREGPGSASVLAVSFDLALDAFEQGRLDDAAAAFAEVLATQRESFGDDSVVLAPTLVMLGQIHLAHGDLRAAQDAAAWAWRLQRDGLPPGHAERGSALGVLAKVHDAAEDYAAFLDVNLQLLADLDAIGDSRDDRALSRNIGWALCKLGRCTEAGPYFERLRRLAVDDVERVASLHGLGRVAWALGDDVTAKREFEAALAIAEADVAAAEPRELAELRLHCAQLLAATHGGGSRIRTLAGAAEATFREIGAGSPWVDEARELAISR